MSWGSPITERLSPELADKLWLHVDRTAGPDGCWPWVGRHTANHVRPQRLAWMVTHGAITRGQVVLATCRDRQCCNPAHLKLGTQRDVIKPHRKTVLTKELAAEIRRLHAKGLKQKEIAERFGTSQANVSFVVRGLTWKAQRKPYKRRTP